MEFHSQICTTREQSERLLALGLKKETADMAYLWYGRAEDDSPLLMDKPSLVYQGIMTTHDLPAWSLHRLVEMMPRYVHTDYYHYERTLFADSICYYKELYNDCGEDLISFDSPNLYDRVINCIEWLIKEGYFNKGYLK